MLPFYGKYVNSFLLKLTKKFLGNITLCIKRQKMLLNIGKKIKKTASFCVFTGKMRLTFQNFSIFFYIFRTTKSKFNII